MPLLVDGHNLIGQLPDIDLADADDEAQLVMLLRRYATRKRGRQVVVVFDHGVYGHPQQLDGYGVTCYFAKSPQDADEQIIKRLRGISRPGDWTLVTSDRHVAGVARDQRVRVISSQEFAAQLGTTRTAAAAPVVEKRDVTLSEAEIAEWMGLFGEQPDAAAPRDDPRPSAAPAEPARRSQARRARRRKRPE